MRRAPFVASMVVLALIGAAALAVLLRERPAPPVSSAPPAAQEYVTQEPSEQPVPQLTRETALALLADDLWMECLPQRVEGKYVSCEAVVARTEDKWTATVTYNGLFDDSVRAWRFTAVIAWRDGRWTVESVRETNLCRNSEEFTTELCP